jgi:hypothetical protein
VNVRCQENDIVNGGVNQAHQGPNGRKKWDCFTPRDAQNDDTAAKTSISNQYLKCFKNLKSFWMLRS